MFFDFFEYTFEGNVIMVFFQRKTFVADLAVIIFEFGRMNHSELVDAIANLLKLIEVCLIGGDRQALKFVERQHLIVKIG